MNKLRVDFVSDISCPWCIIGLRSLEQAIERSRDALSVDLHFQPFELNPAMPAGGQDIDEHLREKYGATPEQSAQTREAIRQRGAALGFNFEMGKRARIYNTFDAHRLLYWAGEHGKQHELEIALFTAYFTNGQDPGNHEVLVRAAAGIGLDGEAAREVLASGRFATEVRERQRFYQSAGIHSVPAIIINERHLISGGQPVEVFEQALRQLAASPA
jgi:predicted DsbA family dithiol-disulfide isomerase